MSGKISFGCDLLHLMRDLQLRASESGEVDTVSDAAARLFLVEWGLSVEEGDEANKLFWDRVNSESLDDLSAVIKRVVGHVKKDRSAQERLVIHFAAIGSMDFKITPEEGSFVSWFQDEFDLRPSELNALCVRGWDLAVALDFYGMHYLEAKKAG